MGLLDGGALYEDITVYPQELVTDGDGNKKTRPSVTGVSAKARFQVQGQSGTSARRAEQDVEGDESEQVYEMRLDRASNTLLGPIGPQAEIEWQGKRWAVFGFPGMYNSSRRTAHTVYTVKRY